MGLLSRLFDPGKGARRAAQAKADQGIFRGGQSAGPGGIHAGFDFSGGRATSSSGLGSFASTLESLQGLSQQGIDQAGAGLPPELLEQLQFGREGLGDVFKSSLATATSDPFALGEGISGKLRELSERRNSRRFNRFTDRLQRTGNLTSSAGTQRAGELEAQESEQGLRFDLAGLDAGRGLQSDAIGRLFGSRRAIQGSGMAELQAMLAQQQQGANIGLAGAQGAAGIAQLPLAFQQALLQAGGTSSNSFFNAANVHSNASQNRTSPLLEALKAGGQFAAGLG